MLDKLSLGENVSLVIPDIIANFYYNHLGSVKRELGPLLQVVTWMLRG